MGTTALSNDATLSALTLSGVRLSPALTSDTTSYTPSVGYTVARTTVAVTTSNENATIEVLDGNDNTLGTGNSVQADLSVGQNTIKVKVTAQDGVHNAGVTFLESGETASRGVESMAEIGGTSTLRGEVNIARNADPPTALAVLEGSTSFIRRTATRTLSNRTLTTEFPRVTLTTMIAPSHDWFVGVSGLLLLDTSGHWLRSHDMDLFPWDAGHRRTRHGRLRRERHRSGRHLQPERPRASGGDLAGARGNRQRRLRTQRERRAHVHGGTRRERSACPRSSRWSAPR